MGWEQAAARVKVVPGKTYHLVAGAWGPGVQGVCMCVYEGVGRGGGRQRPMALFCFTTSGSYLVQLLSLLSNTHAHARTHTGAFALTACGYDCSLDPLPLQIPSPQDASRVRALTLTRTSSLCSSSGNSFGSTLCLEIS